MSGTVTKGPPRVRHLPNVTEVVVAVIGLAVVAAALVANARWFDRHFLPSFLLSRRWYTLIYEVVRWTIAAVGASITVGARSIARHLTGRGQLRLLELAIAAVLALGASEFLLDHVHLRPTEWRVAEEEPRRQPDPRLGWTFVPSHTGYKMIGGRTIEYAFDSAGYRVRRVDQPVDPEQPTILFIGESTIVGEGLTWNETIPAQVEAMIGIQSANLAVHGYSTDQAYLRLQQELPRFRRPVAVVALFMTTLFGRNLDDDRPHLELGLIWMPATEHARLVSLARLLVPYHRTEPIERAIRRTREVLGATVALARARGATPLILVPQLGAEEQIERALRSRILNEADLPYEFVEVDGTWRVARDRHPDARAAHVIAVAVAERLRTGNGR